MAGSGLGFTHDLQIGNEYESDLAAILRSTGDKIEVKADFRAAETGNVFIEFSQPSGPSGLATTHAEWWAIYVVGAYTWLIVGTHRLKELCRIAYQEEHTANGGDGNRFKGVLLPISWLTDKDRRA